VWQDGHVLLLQPLYNGPYTVIRGSLHHFMLLIGDKEDKVSTLRLKPGTDPTEPPAQPRVRGRPPAAVRFWDFTPPRTVAPHRLHFAPQQPTEPHREPFSPGQPPGIFARPTAVLDHAATQPASNHRAPSRLQIRPLGLRPPGLGGALWRLITESSQAKLVPPPPPTRNYWSWKWGSSHTHMWDFNH
jgi:hypothetical protein